MAIKYQSRTNKDGTVTYYTRVELPRHPETNERRREPISAASLDALEDVYFQVMNASRSGTHVLRKETITVAAFFERWLPYYKGRVEGGTYQAAETAVRHSILPGLGGMPLRELSAYLVNQWYQWMAVEQRLAPATIGRRRAVLSTALETAMDWSLVGQNVVKKAKPPKGTPRAVRYLTEDQAKALVRMSDGAAYEPYIVTALGTGMRPSELIDLQWSEVNLAASRITVKHALGESGTSRRYRKGPKTEAGRRVIHIAADLVAYLTERKAVDERKRRADSSWNPKRLVLPGADGDWLWPNNIRRALRRIAQAAGLPPDLRPHELRHTHVAILILRGKAPMKEIQMRLGHASIRVTMDTYGFIYDEVSAAAGASLAGFAPSRFATVEGKPNHVSAQIVDLSTYHDGQKNGAHGGHMDDLDEPIKEDA